LAGRTLELEAFDTLRARVANSLSDRGIVLPGLRGVGKTVLLNEMQRMASEQDWLTVRLEARPDGAGAISARRLLARELVAASRKLARSSPTARMKEALGTISSFNFKVGATGVSLSIDRMEGRADSGDSEIDLLELVEDVAPALAERRRAFGIFVDEMQDLDLEMSRALVAAQHAANQRDLPFYIIGAGLPSLPRVLTEARSYAERLFEYRVIGRLSEADATLALTEPAQRLGAAFTADALRVLLDAADGYPYFIQVFGRTVWNLAAGPVIDVDDAIAAVQFGVEQLDAGFYQSRWERATPAERRLMVAMAIDGDLPSSTAAVAERLNQQPSSLGPFRARLIGKGLLYSPEHGQIAFTVPGMADHIHRRVDLDQLNDGAR